MKSAFLSFILIFTSFICYASLQVQLSYCTFYSESKGPQIELYLAFEADSITLIKSEEGFYGEFEVTCTFDNEESRSSQSHQFTVKSPLLSDSSLQMQPFISQNEFLIDNGVYYMKVSIRDKNSTRKAVETSQRLIVDYSGDSMKLSDIEVFQSSKPSSESTPFTKNGYEIIPYPYEIVPPQLSQIGFYAELYNADKHFGPDSAFLITYYLENYEDGTVHEGFRGFSRKKAASSNVIMGKFLMGNLRSGNYNIRIDVLSRENKLIVSQKVPFHKQSPALATADAYSASFVDRYQSPDSLAQHIKYLQPTADYMEWEFAQNQLTEKDFSLMKKYFLNFWMQRNPENPEKAWLDYYKLVIIANENFGAPMRPGYLSDRGYRYLKYGPPDDRYESFDEAYAYPYEVWMYYKINKQSNRMIIFCNKSMVLNDYIILHSDINGELYNKNWNLELHRMAPGYHDEEEPAFMDYFGNKTKDFTNLPR